MRMPLRLCAMAAFAAGMALSTGGALAALPDGRAYELVSPPDKNGGDVMPEATKTRAAADGSAIAFASLTAFGDVIGTGIASEYVSKRDGTPGTNGWSTHAIMPKLDPLSWSGAFLSQDSTYRGEFSDDLSTGVFQAYTLLTDTPNNVDISNLYLRDDLLSPGDGSYELLTVCVICGGPLPSNLSRPFVADATPDFGHVIFESQENLVAGVSGPRPKLYEWDNGTLRLAGVLPNGSPATCPSGNTCSHAGPNASTLRYTRNTISDDGSRIFFTVPTVNTQNQATGRLYMRVDHASTVQLNASEKTVPDVAQNATYQIASADGQRIFFTSDEQLTNTVGRGLYMYDASRPDTDPDNLTLISVDNEPGDDGTNLVLEGVLGVSDEGDYVYFIANDQLVPGEPILNGNTGIFVWHEGAVAFVGRLNDGIDEADLRLVHQWTLGAITSRVAPDGRHLLFTTHSGNGLTGYEHKSSGCESANTTCSELYLYDAEADTLACASCNDDGAAVAGDALFTLRIGTGGAGATSHLTHPLSDDGDRVFFSTKEPLVPEDRNGTTRDVYMYDAVTGEQHLITSGRGDADAFFLDASRSGDDLFFVSRDRLVGWDVDDNYDLYDARVGGGFPEPPPAAAPECVGDVCQGGLVGPPVAKSPSSRSFFDGDDNAQAKPKKAKKCKKGKVRKKVRGKVRCVKKSKKANRKRSRAADRRIR